LHRSQPGPEGVLALLPGWYRRDLRILVSRGETVKKERGSQEQRPARHRPALLVAAAALLAAGVVPLGRADELHVAVGFAGLLLAMYLLPARAGLLHGPALRGASWLLGGGALASVASAAYGVPMGIAQRVGATCVLGWICLLSWRVVRAPAERRRAV
jgi:hypothetical protein